MMAHLAQFLLAWGPVGVFCLSVLDSSGLPLPGGLDTLLMVLGAQQGAIAYWWAALAVVGSLIGNAILFYIGRESGALYFQKHAHKRSTARFRRWFHHYGLITVFIPAVVPLVPLPLKIFVISAGLLGIRPVTFLAVVLAARVPRYFAMTHLGVQLGASSMTYLKGHIWVLVWIAAGLFMALYALVKIADRYRKRGPAPE
jgi:membrane protein DedA with SNARE-associated domain